MNLSKEDVGNVSVWVKFHGVPMMAFSEDGLSVIATKLAMIELRANMKLKDTIVLAMPKLVGEGFYMCTIRVEYEWKPLKCLSCKVFGHVLDKCPKNIVLDVMKNLKNPRQAARGVQGEFKVVREGGNTVVSPFDHGFFHVASSSTSTTPIVERIDKLEK
ncbi:putative RNA-directed DNA polymerase [Tanacetum coccineum]